MPSDGLGPPSLPISDPARPCTGCAPHLTAAALPDRIRLDAVTLGSSGLPLPSGSFGCRGARDRSGPQPSGSFGCRGARVHSDFHCPRVRLNGVARVLSNFRSPRVRLDSRIRAPAATPFGPKLGGATGASRDRPEHRHLPPGETQLWVAGGISLADHRNFHQPIPRSAPHPRSETRSKHPILRSRLSQPSGQPSVIPAGVAQAEHGLLVRAAGRKRHDAQQSRERGLHPAGRHRGLSRTATGWDEDRSG